MQLRNRKNTENILSTTEKGLTPKKVKGKSSSKNNVTLSPSRIQKVVRNISFCIATILFSLFIYFYIILNNHQMTISPSLNEEELRSLLEKTRNKMLTSEKELKKTKEQLLLLTKEKELLNDTKLHREIKELNQNYKRNILILRKEIQRMCRREVEQKFGWEPYRVEITLNFPNNEDGPDTFIIELASLDLMPHSVYLFLQQVSHNLWNDCSFVYSAPHVVQTTTKNYKNPNDDLKRRFKELDLMSVSFMEYKKEYPHLKYSIGFSAHSNGPGWYISTKDNSEIHGPGGQQKYEFEFDAEPCFGRVIEGFDAIDRIHKMPVKKGHVLKDVVGIKSAKISGWSFLIT